MKRVVRGITLFTPQVLSRSLSLFPIGEREDYAQSYPGFLIRREGGLCAELPGFLLRREKEDYAQSGLSLFLFVGENYAQSGPILSPVLD